MKKLFSILAAIFLLTAPLTSFADVVFGNKFNNENRKKVIKISDVRVVINSPDGYVIPKEKQQPILSNIILILTT